MDTILLKAIKFAIEAHHDSHHKYDRAPYSVHLAIAAHYADVYSSLLPPDERDHVLAAVWLHDTIEDCRVTYRDLEKIFGTSISDMVFAVTNNRGRTREERADESYYKGIRETPYATYIKLCDRLANVRYSLEYNQANMLATYRNELPHFLDQVISSNPTIDYSSMVAALEEIFAQESAI
ncbi:MAG: HD domain-containing protein [Bacteroidales bacterium]|nr:HD domain-containing protein [Bacteroidales bacterium]